MGGRRTAPTLGPHQPPRGWANCEPLSTEQLHAQRLKPGAVKSRKVGGARHPVHASDLGLSRVVPSESRSRRQSNHGNSELGTAFVSQRPSRFGFTNGYRHS
jgi:hypothetical protein